MIVSITGASGADIAFELLKILKKEQIEIVLIISKNAEKVIELETEYKISDFLSLADHCYQEFDLAAAPSSGTHKFNSMIIVPCSMKTLSAIAHGFSDNLITRAADVTIKENKKLILVVRESPLSVIHLENMLKLAKIGVIIAPPIPSYYIKPNSVADLTRQLVGRILSLLNINTDIKRWGNF